MKFSVLELCGGGGGQALGLELADFAHAGIVEFEPEFCTTLRTNRPSWNVLQQDVRHVRAQDFSGVDLVAAGVPCPPFSIAGKQLGGADERDMFPAALDIVRRTRPRAVLLENVPGFATTKFEPYRIDLIKKLDRLGYKAVDGGKVLQAADFGVAQLRPRFVLVALRQDDLKGFKWPPHEPKQCLVGEELFDLMAANGWPGAASWVQRAAAIAPTIVGGSRKHGGPDLGPTRAKAQWRKLGVDGMGLAAAAPNADFPIDGFPRLTVRMVARLQSFPDEWVFAGTKTASYRQVGNAFPPRVARAVGLAIGTAFRRQRQRAGRRLPQAAALEKAG